jgi:hypothetical protein
VSESGGSTLWKAIDEILARAVAVRTFSPDFPHVNEVVTAARAASRLTDPRLTQVFDADDSHKLAYVVSEWVSGETLHHMVASRGPLEPGRAATLLCEAAEAIAAAHAAGLAHLRLSPDDLLWTTGGTVKLLGLGVEAALGGFASETPALIDAQGLGRMLYAALTAHTLVADESGLPAAPVVDGRIYAPRQLQAGVPQALDAIVCRTLDIGPPTGQEPLTTPAALAEALATVPRTPLPLFAGLAASPAPAPPPRPAARTVPSATPQPPPPRPQARPANAQRQPAAPAHGSTTPTPYTPGPAARPPVNRPLIAAAAALATIVVGIGGWQITHMGGGEPKPTTPPSSATAPPSPTTTKLSIADASGFDPTQPDHPDPTARSTGNNAVDDSSSTAWRTQTYRSADFGKLKGGLGVLLDMGRPVKVSDVKATLPRGEGATLELRMGSATDLGALKVVAREPSTSGMVRLQPAVPTEGRYVLLWFTKLPNSLKAQISNVDVMGWTG